MSGQIGVPSIFWGSQNLGDSLRDKKYPCLQPSKLFQPILAKTLYVKITMSSTFLSSRSVSTCINQMAGAQISLLLFFFNILPKQQNILTRQSKLCELLIKSVSCVLGRIKILMMHFLEFVCVKMHDFCVNAIPVQTYISFITLHDYLQL